MSDTTQTAQAEPEAQASTTLDIAQLIAEALARTDEPRMTAVMEFNPETDTEIGEVPEHLRHLHNLLNELGDELRAAEEVSMKASKKCDVVRSVFFTALDQQVPSNGDNFNSTVLCNDWKVAGRKGDDEDIGKIGRAHV